MALDKLKKDELAVLGEVLGKALVHHDPDDDRTYDLGALANTASRNPSIASALIGEILKNVDLGALLAKIVDRTVGFRIAPDDEVSGVDLSEHAESAYDIVGSGGATGGSFAGVGHGLQGLHGMHGLGSGHGAVADESGEGDTDPPGAGSH